MTRWITLPEVGHGWNMAAGLGEKGGILKVIRKVTINNC